MKHDLVITEGTLASASEIYKADIGKTNGKIVTMGEDLQGDDIINASGK